MDEMSKKIVVTAMKKMLHSAHFSICTFDQCAEVLHVRPSNDTHRKLRALHCINWNEMPADVNQYVIDSCLELFSLESIDIFPVAKAVEPNHGWRKLIR